MKLLTFLLLTCLLGCIQAQTFEPDNGHQDYITALHLSQDEQYIYSVSRDQSIRKWDLKSGEEIDKIQMKTGLSASVMSKNKDFMWVGGFLMSESKGQPIHKIDLKTKQSVQSYASPSHPSIYQIWVDEEENVLVALGTKDSVHVWNLQTGQLITSKNFGNGTIYFGKTTGFIAEKFFYLMMPNGNLYKLNLKTHETTLFLQNQNPFLCPIYDKNLYILGKEMRKFDTDEVITTNNYEPTNISTTAVSQDSKKIIFKDKNYVIRMMEWNTTSKSYEIKEASTFQATREFSNLILDSQNLMFVSMDKYFQKCSLNPINTLREYKKPDYIVPVFDIQLSDNQCFWITDEPSIHTFDFTSFTNQRKYTGFKGKAQVIELSKDGSHLAAASNYSEWLIWNTENQNVIWTNNLMDTLYRHGIDLIWKENDSFSQAHSGCVFENSLGKSKIKLQEIPDECVNSVASLGNHWICGGNDHLWKYDENYQVTKKIKVQVGVITKIDVSVNQKHIAVAGRKGLYIMDTNFENQVKLVGHTDWINDICFSTDCKYLYTCSGTIFGNDNTIKKWDVSTGRLLLTLKGHTKGVENIQLNQQGTQIWSASNDGRIRIWDTNKGECLAIIFPTQVDNDIRYVVFSPKGYFYGDTSDLKKFSVAGFTKFPLYSKEESLTYFKKTIQK